jgi:hypothetical protein
MIVGYCQQEFQPLDPKLLFKQSTDKTSLADHQQFYPCSQSVQLSTYDSGFVDDQTVGSLMTPNEINESEEKDKHMSMDDILLIKSEDDDEDDNLPLNELRNSNRQKWKNVSKRVSFQGLLNKYLNN